MAGAQGRSPLSRFRRDRRSLRRRRLVGFAKITRDVTSNYKAQMALEQSERRFRLLVSGVKDYALYMLDKTGVITSGTRAVSKLRDMRRRRLSVSIFRDSTPKVTAPRASQQMRCGSPWTKKNMKIFTGRGQSRRSIGDNRIAWSSRLPRTPCPGCHVRFARTQTGCN